MSMRQNNFFFKSYPKLFNWSVHRHTTIETFMLSLSNIKLLLFFFAKSVNFPLQLPQDLSIKARTSCSSVLRIPPSANSSPNTFFTSAKTNFRVTSCREDSPLIAYNTPPWFPCPFNFQNVTDVRPSSPAQKTDLTSSPTSQASVMANAMDLTVAKNKTLQWRQLKCTICCLFRW